MTATFLYAGGDSFTYGDEICDDPETRMCLDHDKRIRSAWPARLADHLMIPRHKNDGMGGSSNDRIYRRCIEFVSEWLAVGKEPSELFVVLGWSSPIRTEFVRCGSGANEHDTRRPYLQYYQNILDSPFFYQYSQETRDFIRMYDEYFASEEESITRYANQIVTLQSFLKTHRVPFLFFNAAWVVRPGEGDHNTFSLIDLKTYYNIDDYNETMFGWIRNIGQFPLGPRLHPGADGHDAWAQKLWKFIYTNELV